MARDWRGAGDHRFEGSAVFRHRFRGSAVGPSLLRQAASRKHGARRGQFGCCLLSIHPKIFAGLERLELGDSAKQANAVELLDNLLTGDVKRYMFPFYGVAALDRNPAVHTLKAVDAVHALQAIRSGL